MSISHTMRAVCSTSLTVLGVMLGFQPATASAQVPVRKWAVYYADSEPAERFSEFDLLVFDADAHPPLAPLRDRERLVLGYISVGEAERYRSYFGRTEPWRLGENPNWPGSYFIDVRSKGWQSLIVNEIAAVIVQRGFDGFFLDTIDNPIELERRDPTTYGGMKSAAAAIVRDLRRRFPNSTIIMNRGYELIPEVGDVLDFILGESVYHAWDFRRELYRHVARKGYLDQVRILQDAAARFPRLRVLTLDYCNPDAVARVQEIYRTQRNNGFLPYVSTLELNRVFEEPEP